MPGKLDVYNLGELGINRVLSPVQIRDGELLVCQNAVATPIGGQLALQKRPGMNKLNATTAAGTLLSIINIPFANPTGFGNNWQSVPATGLNLALKSIAWSPTLGMFVAVGDTDVSGNAMRSTDGLNWTAMSIATTASWRNVIWADGPGLFVAAGRTAAGASTVAYSSDGINWTSATGLVAATERYRIAYAPSLNRYVVIPSGTSAGVGQYTSDLAGSWTLTNAFTAGNFGDLEWSESLGLFVATDPSGTADPQQVMTSADGITWTRRTTNNNRQWTAVRWSDVDAKFIAIAQTGSGVMTSPDGVVWTAVNSAANANTWQGITETPAGRLVAVADTAFVGNQVMYSDDGGATWTATAAAASRAWTDVVYSPELEIFVAVASDGDPMYSP